MAVETEQGPQAIRKLITQSVMAVVRHPDLIFLRKVLDLNSNVAHYFSLTEDWNFELRISKLEIPFNALSAKFCRFADACEYCQQFGRFLEQPVALFSVSYKSFLAELKPVLGLSSLFLYYTYLVDKILARLRAIGFTVVGTDVPDFSN